LDGAAAAALIASESRVRNAIKADSAATGSDTLRIEQQADASSIQVGIRHGRATSTPTGLHRAQVPLGHSITW
jgi:hypothetical protein